MNRFLWILQILLGLSFIGFGLIHLTLPEGLPVQIAWMYDLPTGIHITAGVAEILAGLGLILPGAFGIRPELTILAALGLIVVMISAAVWHATREEWQSIGINAFNIVLLGIIAYGRWRVRPLEAK